MGKLSSWLASRWSGIAAGSVLGLVVVPIASSIPALATDAYAQLSFPWDWGTEGKFTGGPHNWEGLFDPAHPWNSLDFVPRGSPGKVFAARGGTAYTNTDTNECPTPGFIRIVHGDGFQTSYYHLDPNSIQVANGGYVTRGTYLGNIGTSTPCGGFAQGSHVHFSLWYLASGPFSLYSPPGNYNSMGVDLGGIPPTATTMNPPQGVQIGSWYLNDTGGQYSGCMTPINGGTTACSNNNATCSPSPTCAYIVNDWLSEQVPVARRPGGQTEDLLVRGTTVHGYQTPTDPNGNPLGWTDLGGALKGSPTAVWDSWTTELDVFCVGITDGIYYKRYRSGLGWDNGWTQVAPGSLTAGTSATESVNAERRPQTGGVDLFFLGPAGDAKHAYLFSDLSFGYVESLGSPPGGGPMGPPVGRWDPLFTRLDVFAIGSDHHPWHIGYPLGGPWGSWMQLPGTSASASTSSSGATASIAEMVMAIRAPDDSMDLFFRGTANDAIRERTDSTGNWLSSESLGGGVKAAPDGKWNANQTRLDVFVIGTNDQIWLKTWNLGSPWSGWSLLPLGGTWG